MALVVGERAGTVAQNGDRLRVESLVDLDMRVDAIVERHKTHLATLERDLIGRTAPAPASTAPMRSPATGDLIPPRMDPSARAALDEDLLAARRQRERMAAELRPREEVVRPPTDPPLVTRGGVFYVPPDYMQAKGLDQTADARLVRAGFRSVPSFLKASDDELVAVTGLSKDVIEAARHDLDLTRLPGVTKEAADLLRLVGVQSISRLATRDPARILDDIRKHQARHRFRLPEVVEDDVAVARLVQHAKERVP